MREPIHVPESEMFKQREYMKLVEAMTERPQTFHIEGAEKG